MNQITIDLPDELVERLERAAEAASVSPSEWIARLIEDRLFNGWPREVRELFGSWPEDFPDVDEIRGT